MSLIVFDTPVSLSLGPNIFSSSNLRFYISISVVFSLPGVCSNRVFTSNYMVYKYFLGFGCSYHDISNVNAILQLNLGFAFVNYVSLSSHTIFVESDIRSYSWICALLE